MDALDAINQFLEDNGWDRDEWHPINMDSRGHYPLEEDDGYMSIVSRNVVNPMTMIFVYVSDNAEIFVDGGPEDRQKFAGTLANPDCLVKLKEVLDRFDYV
jgi:hypothetical protein